MKICPVIFRTRLDQQQRSWDRALGVRTRGSRALKPEPRELVCHGETLGLAGGLKEGWRLTRSGWRNHWLAGRLAFGQSGLNVSP